MICIECGKESEDGFVLTGQGYLCGIKCYRVHWKRCERERAVEVWGDQAKVKPL
jgi:hypothetical protein